MKNLNNDRELIFIGDALEYPVEYTSARLDAKVETFPLAAVSKIDVIDCIENDAVRKTIDHQDRQHANVIEGAVAGGLIDAIVGDGDSIINGVLLGATAGYLFTGSEMTPKAKIAISFKCGRCLPLEVDSSELTKLVACWREISDKGLNKDNYPNKRALTKDEQLKVLSHRSRKTTLGYLHAMVSPALIAIFIVTVLHFYEFFTYHEGIQITLNGRPGAGSESMNSAALVFGGFFDVVFNVFTVAGLIVAGMCLVQSFLATISGLVNIWRLPKLARWEVLGFFDEDELSAATKLGLVVPG